MTSFKSDESFLEKISIGAIGTQKVFENLEAQNNIPIELERGSMSYKIWKKIKIKRIRVPDILCVNSGVRIESRAKTKLEITMSHSVSDPERGWDFGMDDNDYVALVVCTKNGDKPIDWLADELVQYISVRDLREAEKEDKVVLIKPKGAEEGFEARITWPASIASSDGVIKQITEDRIQFSRENDNRTISLSLNKKGIKLSPLVDIGDEITKNQIIASSVDVSQHLPEITVDEGYFHQKIKSTSLSERYAAAKALAYYPSSLTIQELQNKINDRNEHIYVKLEVAASLAKLSDNTGYEFLKSCLDDTYLQNVLETVIVLAEIKTIKSAEILSDILQNENFDSEIRAGAAWGLGELNQEIALPVLVQSFSSINENIKVEAARALAKLTADFTTGVLSHFNSSTSEQKPGIAWALSKSPNLSIDELLNNLNSDIDTRQWLSYIVGMQGEEKYINEIEKLKQQDEEIYFAVTVLWKILSSWINNLEEY